MIQKLSQSEGLGEYCQPALAQLEPFAEQVPTDEAFIAPNV